MSQVTLTGKHTYTVMQSKDGYMVARYELPNEVELPDGKKTKVISAKGYKLPEDKGITFSMTGTFEIYTNKDGKDSYTLNVESVTEVIPTEEESILAYLTTLSGVGKVLAERLYDALGKNVFDVIEKTPSELTKIKGISPKKAEKIQIGYLSRQSARKLFEYLFKYGVKDKQIMRIHNELGDSAVETIKQNPYSILKIANIGFKTADAIARKSGLSSDNPDRIRAGIVEVLMQAEYGGEIFSKASPYPDFVLHEYLRVELFDKLYADATFSTGGTYLPRDILYLMLLRLLKIEISERSFDNYLFELHAAKEIFLAIDRSLSPTDFDYMKVYRKSTAVVEYKAAEKLARLSSASLPSLPNLSDVITDKQAVESILLSNEQKEAVVKALTNPVSIITGGPGTGKTSILKIILSVFKHYCPKDGVLLLAPTGKAAKRMSEQTNMPAHTIHKATNIYADDDGNIVETDENAMFTEKLIIVDESSMVGNTLLYHLLSHINVGTRLVIVGDVDQLPSIETGAVLRELLDSNELPTTRLTKTFRQANGSSIITNASRIKVGETNLDFDDEFQLIECPTSEDISDKIVELLPDLISKYGEDNVMCITAFRNKTASGSNALNEAIRNTIRKPKEKDRFFESRGMKIYEGDRVMYTRNTESLTNGDTGTVERILKTKNSLIVTCRFDGNSIGFEDEETGALELAYATTIHKSQGSEAACVLMVCDKAHKVLNRKCLVYTGATRSRNQLIILGQKEEALSYAILTEDNLYRTSALGSLIHRFKTTPSTKTPGKSPAGTVEGQLSFL